MLWQNRFMKNYITYSLLITFTLLLLPVYSFAEDSMAQSEKVCHIPTGRPNYKKIDIAKGIEKSSCKKGDVLWIIGLYPDNTSYIASRTCEIGTISIGPSSVICKYSGKIRELSSPF